MKRKSEQEISGPVEKKQKIDIWETINQIVNQETINSNGHIVLKSGLLTHGICPKKKINGKLLPLYTWYYALQKKNVDIVKSGRFKKLCDQHACISHYAIQTKGISSVLDMTEDDYKFAWKQYNENSKESDIDTGNLELKTKCQLWIGHVHKSGYGEIRFLKKNMRSSRFSWMISNKRDADKKLVCRHKCKNRSCVNPDHLEMGTQKENMKDAAKRDHTCISGQKHHFSTISDEKVKEIFASRTNGSTQKDRAKLFDVSLSTIRQIDRCKIRKHLFTDEELSSVKPVKRVPVTQELFDKIKKYQAANVSTADCAKLLGSSKTTVTVVYKQEKFDPKIIRRSTLKWYEKKVSDSEKKNQEEYLKSKCDIVEDSGGVHWLYSKTKFDGYADISFKSAQIAAHRFSYWLHNDFPIMKTETIVRHKCKGHKNCVNPDHLEIGSKGDNGRDRIRDGTSLRGELNPKALISNETATQIKNSKGQGTQLERAKKFGVSLGVVGNIDCGKTWKDC